MTRIKQQVALLMVSVLLVFGFQILTPPPAFAGTQKVGCVIYPNRVIISGAAVFGEGEQICTPGWFIRQRLKVRLQEKRVITLWPDEWRTKRTTKWTQWSFAHYTSRTASLWCDSTKHKNRWRVKVEGQFDNEYGQRQYGRDTSLEKTIWCHVNADQTKPTS